MLIVAKDKKTLIETVWCQVDSKEIAEGLLAAAERGDPMWTFSLVEDQPCYRDLVRDPVWKLQNSK